jgi:pilus assembly protein CpaE
MQLKNILILASSAEDLHRIEDQLRDESDWHLTLLRVTETLNGNLRRAFSEVDLALVCCRSGQSSLLEAIDALPEAHRPRVLVCGDLNSPEATRLLVRIGVVDLLPSTPTTPELQSAVRRALREVRTTDRSEREACVVSVFDASGGTSAPLIAGSLAHLVAEASRKTLLIDLDLIYAPLAAMFGLNSTRGIVEAIRNVDSLDMTALEGYVVRHSSGLDLLTSVATGAIPPSLNANEFSRVLALCQKRYEFIFIAANRWLDPLSIEAASASHHVLVVVSQSLTDVRLATRLRQLLTQSVGVPESVVRIILNRYSTRSPVKDAMISKVIGATPFAKIPEDGPLVRRSLDSGVPLAELDRHSPLTEALIALETQLTGAMPVAPVSAVRRVFATFSRGER